jgi:hydrogenase maturation protease
VGSVLVIGYGNPGRADDGLGPAAAEAVSALELPGVEVESGYQLAVEDAEAIARHATVLFVDASVSGAEPFAFHPVVPDGAVPLGYSSHVMLPPQVLALAHELFGSQADGYVLAVRGYEFDQFREGLSADARANLQAALDFIVPVLRSKTWPCRAGAAPEHSERG